MKILHACLSSFFIDDRSYQENELVRENAKQGHDVLVLASTHIHDETGKRAYCEPGEYQTAEGTRVIRLPYHPRIPKRLAPSLRYYRGVYKIIEDFQPDVILFHGICAGEIATFARYHRNNPDVVLYADTHTDFINSARGFVSKWGLHYLFYRPVILRALPEIKKVLSITQMTTDFAHDFYGIPKQKIEFFPLGGHPLADKTYTQKRDTARKALGIGEKQIVFIQSGKQNASKKLLVSLKAFLETADPSFRFLIVGIIMDDIRQEAEALIASDTRIDHLGWKSPQELEDLLCASDVYLQPGSQSSTMQTAVCCRCAVILEDLVSLRSYVDGNGWMLGDPSELLPVLKSISDDTAELRAKQDRSTQLAVEVLDYSKISQRILK